MTWNGKDSGEDDDMMTFEETHGFVFFAVHFLENPDDFVSS